MSAPPFDFFCCEHCGASLQGEPYTRDDGTTGRTHREIGYSAHDRIQFWICPDCNGTWPRFAEQSGYRARAEELRRQYDAGELS